MQHRSHHSNAHVTISSNTLFHFTNSLEHVMNILERTFRPNLSLEDLSCLQDGLKVAIPMVSFCDIPLSQTQTHMRFYGYYGIGLSKTWGQKNGINPVLYAYKDSHLTVVLSKCFSWTHRKYLTDPFDDPEIAPELLAILASANRLEKKDAIPGNQYQELWDQLLGIQCFIKPYEGAFSKGNQSFRNVRFYDEREWRFVPDLEGDLFNFLLDEDTFNNTETREKTNHELHTRSRISFKPNDVKYIIVSREKEILPMIKGIEEIKGDRFTQNEIKLLSSKIISAEQIAKDF